MEKYYYIMDNDIVVYNDPQESLMLLSDEQVHFHLENATASSSEVLRMQLNAEYVENEEIKRSSMEMDIKMLLLDTDGVVARYKDEIELGDGTTITAEKYKEVLLYRKYLRDLSQDVNYPFVQINLFE